MSYVPDEPSAPPVDYCGGAPWRIGTDGYVECLDTLTATGLSGLVVAVLACAGIVLLAVGIALAFTHRRRRTAL